MEARVAVLESKIETLATRADIEGVRADIFKTDASHKVWMIATILGLLLGMAGILFSVSNSISTQISAVKAAVPASTPAAQNTPIIIQVPAPIVQPASAPMPRDSNKKGHKAR
jgi:hypothetical protein